jgi:hypothetical protein
MQQRQALAIPERHDENRGREIRKVSHWGELEVMRTVILRFASSRHL